jgi:hypothetical protein
VTVSPARIVTLSVLAGIVAGLQVEVEFQSPLPLLVWAIFAACARPAKSSTSKASPIRDRFSVVRAGKKVLCMDV